MTWRMRRACPRERGHGTRRGKRAFTLDHLQAIEERLGMPLGAVLLATMKKMPRDKKLAKARELAVDAERCRGRGTVSGSVDGAYGTRNGVGVG
jgi:hypothetical protein